MSDYFKNSDTISLRIFLQLIQEFHRLEYFGNSDIKYIKNSGENASRIPISKFFKSSDKNNSRIPMKILQGLKQK
jgi:hypothetical protein